MWKFTTNLPSIVAFTPVDATTAASLAFKALNSIDRGTGTG